MLLRGESPRIGSGRRVCDFIFVGDVVRGPNRLTDEQKVYLSCVQANRIPQDGQIVWRFKVMDPVTAKAMDDKALKSFNLTLPDGSTKALKYGGHGGTKENPADMLAMLRASAAIHLSPIPWAGPIGGVRVGRVDGKWIANPTYAETATSECELIIAATKDAIVMVEGDANEMSEADLVEALFFGKQAMQPAIQLIEKMREAAGKPKTPFTTPVVPENVVSRVKQLAHGNVREACNITAKFERYGRFKAIKKEVVAKVVAELGPEVESQAKQAYEDLRYTTMRLQVVDESGAIVRLDPAGKHHAERAGFSWNKGDVAAAAALDKVAEIMADTIVAALTVRPLPHEVEHLYLTDPIADFGRIDGIMFSGGVAEYVYEREERDFGDLGRRLGRAIRQRIESGALPWPVLPAGECIRATALGASEYSVQLSGNTSYISAPGTLLPRRNLQVLQPPFDCAETIDREKLANAIRSHIVAFDLADSDREIALALRWTGLPSHARLAAFAAGIKGGLGDRLSKKQPIFIMLDGDVAQTLGHILREELHVDNELLVIDGVVLWDFDYIDLGRIRMPSYTVPVTIKSLVFSEDPRGPRPRQRLHHREHDPEPADTRAHHHPHDHHDHDHRHEHVMPTRR